MHFVPRKFSGNFPTFRTKPDGGFVQNEAREIPYLRRSLLSGFVPETFISNLFSTGRRAGVAAQSLPPQSNAKAGRYRRTPAQYPPPASSGRSPPRFLPMTATPSRRDRHNKR